MFVGNGGGDGGGGGGFMAAPKISPGIGLTMLAMSEKRRHPLEKRWGADGQRGTTNSLRTKRKRIRNLHLNRRGRETGSQLLSELADRLTCSVD